MTKDERAVNVRVAYADFVEAINENLGAVIDPLRSSTERKPTREKSLALTPAETALLWAQRGLDVE